MRSRPTSGFQTPSRPSSPEFKPQQPSGDSPSKRKTGSLGVAIAESMPQHLPEVTRSNSKRQDTNATQTSNCTSKSDSSGSSLDSNPKKRSEVERQARVNRPVSKSTLASFRTKPFPLYWPCAGGHRGLVITAELKTGIDLEFRRSFKKRAKTDKCVVWSAAVRMEDGTDEHIAIKTVSCDYAPKTRGFKRIQREFKLLARINHNHIVAALGSYVRELQSVDGPGSEREYGLMLFPLATASLDEVLEDISGWNAAQKLRADQAWMMHTQVDVLLDYITCLCGAVLYLHAQAEPIKHRDIKPANILIDSAGMVFLADFDIAKQYPDTKTAQTTGFTERTDRYAPQTVRERRARSFDWDIYALGCVFLEMATVAFGETMDALHKHLADDGGKVFYSVALKDGAIGSWVKHLKEMAKSHPERIPLERFQKSSSGDSQLLLGKFLDQIQAMMWVTMETHEGAILAAWRHFEQTRSKGCNDCEPKHTHYEELPSRRLALPSLRTRTLPPKDPNPVVLTPVSEGDSGSSSRPDVESSEMPPDLSPLKGISRRLVVWEDDGRRPTQNEHGSNHDAVTHKHNPDSIGENGAESEDNLANELPVAQPRLDHLRNIHRPPKLMISRSSSRSNDDDAAHSPSSGSPTIGDDGRSYNPTAPSSSQSPATTHEPSEWEDSASQSSLMVSTISTRHQDGQFKSENDRADTRESIGRRNSQESGSRHSTSDLRNAQSESLSEQKLAQKPDPDPQDALREVRVITFSPRDKRGLSYRDLSCITNTELLVYQNDSLQILPKRSSAQADLRGAFIEIPSFWNNTKLRLPGSPGVPGDTIDVRELRRDFSSFGQGFRWLMGGYKLLYIPGQYSESVLRECLR